MKRIRNFDSVKEKAEEERKKTRETNAEEIKEKLKIINEKALVNKLFENKLKDPKELTREQQKRTQAAEIKASQLKIEIEIATQRKVELKNSKKTFLSEIQDILTDKREIEEENRKLMEMCDGGKTDKDQARLLKEAEIEILLKKRLELEDTTR